MLQLRNTLSKKKESFIPLAQITSRAEGKRFVSLYTCGPTVYDYASIGNFSAYIMSDLVKRYLKFLGYPVRHVMNITDVGHLTADADVAGDDKLEAAAKKEGIDPWKIAEKYTEQFLADAKDLDIIPDPLFVKPESVSNISEHESRVLISKATDHIEAMLMIIKKLIHDGHAYVAESGVYFDVTTYPEYGKLSGNTLDHLKAGARVEVNDDKKHPADFALWKLNQPHHIMQWDSEWGRGYPGWHIECSAMSMQYLGEELDIHTGGEDNIFPHHECEIAQSECFSDKHFVKFWLHKYFLTVDGQKMSKSLGNTYRLQDLVDKGFDPADFRMLILAAHYRTGVNFTWDALQAARERRLRWQDAALRSQEGNAGQFLDSLQNALNDDLNTPEAFALIDGITKSDHAPSREVWKTIDQIFGLSLFAEQVIPRDIQEKAHLLDAAREAKNYTDADNLRAEIIGLGYEVITTHEGTKVKKK